MANLQKISLRKYKELLSNGFYKLGNGKATVENIVKLVEAKNFDMALISKNDLFHAEISTTKCVHVNVTNSADDSRVNEHFQAGEKYYSIEHNGVLYLLHDYNWESTNISIKVARV